MKIAILDRHVVLTNPHGVWGLKSRSDPPIWWSQGSRTWTRTIFHSRRPPHRRSPAKCQKQIKQLQLKTHQQILDLRAVAATIWFAPGDNKAIFQDGSKCFICGLNLPHILQLILDCEAVTAIICLAPGDNPVTSAAPQCKSVLICC